MRAVVTNYRGGGAPDVALGANLTNAVFANLPTPGAGGGEGAGVHDTAMPALKTVQVSGEYGGAINVEISNDGGTSYELVASFQPSTPGIQTFTSLAEFIRVTRPSSATGAPVVNLAAADLAADSGGGGAAAYINFVFRPGGVQAGNVYTDWAELMAAANSVQGWKTIQIDNSQAACVIPAGVWDMTQTELVGFVTGALGAGPSVTVADGASFTNLRKVGGELTIVNANTVNAPVVIAAAAGAAAVFEFGAGIFGDFPQLNNTGGAPFWDMSALAAGQQFLIRMAGVITGTAAAIQMGASQGTLSLSIFDCGRIQAGMIAGTDPAAICSVFLFGNSGQLCRQSAFAGTITYGRPNSFTGLPGWPRFWMFPASVSQGAIVPSAVPFVANTGLGMGACLRFNTTAGNIAQPLPTIRAAAPAIGSFSTTDGVIESTGLVVIVKNEVGANAVNVSPAGADTINGGAGAVAVAQGAAKMFISDGVSNWISFP
jgi:hypothetical protein